MQYSAITVQYSSIIYYNIVQYITRLYNTVQHSTIYYNILLRYDTAIYYYNKLQYITIVHYNTV